MPPQGKEKREIAGTLLQSGISIADIMMRTGHRNLQSVQVYVACRDI